MATSTIEYYANKGAYRLTSENPVTVPLLHATGYGSYLIMGFCQGVGSVMIAIKLTNNTISSIIDLFTGTNFTNSALSFSFESNRLTITSTRATNSYIRVINS